MLAYAIHLARLSGELGGRQELTHRRSSYLTAHAAGFGLGSCHAFDAIARGLVTLCARSYTFAGAQIGG